MQTALVLGLALLALAACATPPTPAPIPAGAATGIEPEPADGLALLGAAEAVPGDHAVALIRYAERCLGGRLGLPILVDIVTLDTPATATGGAMSVRGFTLRTPPRPPVSAGQLPTTIYQGGVVYTKTTISLFELGQPGAVTTQSGQVLRAGKRPGGLDAATPCPG